MAIGSRRASRERALSLLYEAEVKDMAPAALLAELPVEPDRFAADLVAGVDEHLAQIDELVARYAVDWAVERMPLIDRNVLRLAVYELLYRPDVPLASAISEAVELAKRYSTDESGRFVNGVLANIAHEVRPG